MTYFSYLVRKQVTKFYIKIPEKMVQNDLFDLTDQLSGHPNA